ncbi:MAG: putative manganese transporter [Candidatus Borkfalkiaceae bacterium]|nr:putative manganese transporter [Christensenellaceae bacterium]
MWETLLDALLDSLKILAFVFVFNVIFSFIFQNRKSNRLTVPIGAALGLLPQCGFSVIAAEKFNKKQISGGTLLAVFLATSDEAIPVLLSEPTKAITIFPLLLLKFIIALAVGFLFDLIFKYNPDNAANVENNKNEHEQHSDCGCGHHTKKESFVHEHLLHPLIHSAQAFAVVLIFNVIFSLIIYFIGEETFSAFLKSNAYLSPLFSVLVGLIPNCASSVVISELFISGNISFGACLGGLLANAGVGLTIVFARGSDVKSSLKILAALIISGLFFGYLCCLIIGF